MPQWTQWFVARPFAAALVALSAGTVIAPNLAIRDLGVSSYFLGLTLAVFGATERRWIRFATLGYLALALSAHVGHHASGGSLTTPGVFVLDLVFAAVVPVFVIRRVLSRGTVDTEELAGAVVSYMLLGVFFGALHMTVHTIAPGAYTGLTDDAANESWQFIYFSFVTLTTLGYGDIVPSAPDAQGIAAIEALVGQAYLAILIGHLVSKMGESPVAPATDET